MIRRIEDYYFRLYLTKLPVFQAIFRAIEAEALSNFPLKEPILDLGCGDGIFCKALFNQRRQIIGIDINDSVLKEAKKRGVYKRLIKADAACLPFKDGQFKSILSNSVLEHIPNLEPVLKEAARVLAHGGVLVLTAPSDKRKKLWQFFRLFTWLGMPRLASRAGDWENKFFKHYHCWSGEKWQKELKKAGFRRVAYQYRASPAIALLSDFFLLFAPIAFLEKKIFGHYFDWKKYPMAIIGPFLPSFKDDIDGENGAVIVVRAQR